MLKIMGKKIGLFIALTTICIMLVGCGNVEENGTSVQKQSITQSKNERLENLVLNKGQIISFGNYNGKQLKWNVLEVSTNMALIMMYGAVDCRKFHSTPTDVTWENSDIRKWLNNDFYNEAFSANEKKRILDTKLTNKPNSEYGTSSGNSTVDKVFLLSLDEVTTMFKTSRERMFIHFYKGGTQRWWLRTAGKTSNLACFVNDSGNIHEEGEELYNTNAIIPVMWIILDSN